MTTDTTSASKIEEMAHEIDKMCDTIHDLRAELAALNTRFAEYARQICAKLDAANAERDDVIAGRAEAESDLAELRLTLKRERDNYGAALGMLDAETADKVRWAMCRAAHTTGPYEVGKCQVCGVPVLNNTAFGAIFWHTEDGADFFCADHSPFTNNPAISIDDAAVNPFANE